MSKEKIACIAGTPIDTKMGVDKLIEQGFDAMALPSSKNPTEEMLFQISSTENKLNKMRQILDTIKKEGINKVLVYCNSLSSAVDFDYLSKEKEIKIITPFDVYKKEATNYKSIAVISANAVATSNIERVMLNYNKDLHIVSVANLQLVWSIENGLSAKKIIEKHKLKELCDWFKDNGSEALLLGCTHFPYLYTELQKVSKISILDPTKKMIDLL